MLDVCYLCGETTHGVYHTCNLTQLSLRQEGNVRSLLETFLHALCREEQTTGIGNYVLAYASPTDASRSIHTMDLYAVGEHEDTVIDNIVDRFLMEQRFHD